MKFNTLIRHCLTPAVCWLGMAMISLHAGTVNDSLKGQLLTSNGQELQPFDESKLSEVKIFAFYYSAHWCPPCRAFTPELVKFYNHEKKNHPEFELVFVSHDKSREAMIEYMQVMKMPWPATEYGKGGDVRKYCGNGIPCLVIVDENGKVLADTFNGQTYLGPESPMKFLGKLLAKNSNSSNRTSSDFDSLFKKKPL